MEHDLLTPQDYDGLPDEPELKFLEIERIARRKMYEVIRGENGDKFEHDFRAQYMVTVAEAANEIGIEGLTLPNQSNDFSDDFGWFQQQVHGLITRLRLRNAKRNSAYSVKLANRTRGKIELQITKLRDLIAASSFSASKKAALNARLDELYAEINNNGRASFAKLMHIIGFISMGVAGAVGIGADGPAAIANITALIGQDKEAEEAEALRLGTSAHQCLIPDLSSAAFTVPTIAGRTAVTLSRGITNQTSIFPDLDPDVPF